MSKLSPTDKKKLELARLKTRLKDQLITCFDAEDKESRPNDKQLEIIKDQEHLIFYILGSNQSGKTATGSRIVTWWFQGTHPHQVRPKEWGKGPLQILVVSKSNKIAENEIWAKKIKPLLVPGEYKEHRNGTALEKIENLKNGNTIIFFSHQYSGPSRENVQGFTSHVVWMDEMPADPRILSELVVRTVANRGRLYATFTPLVESEDIKQIVDNASGNACKKLLLITDNPKLKADPQRMQEVIDDIKQTCQSEAEVRARLYGEWYYSSRKVFSYVREKNLWELPQAYTTRWRHVAVCDPSASGTTGLTVWAEDPFPRPDAPRWYNVGAWYLEGDAAFELVDKVEDIIRPYNIILKVCDCNPSGFYKEANSKRRKLGWGAVSDKKDRKEETIENLNTALAQNQVALTKFSHHLDIELLGCKRHEDNDKIIKESKYHCADTARYFVDRMPKPLEEPGVVLEGTAAIRAQWKTRKAKENRSFANKERRMRIISGGGRNKWIADKLR